MNNLLQEYKNKKPLIVFEWNDSETNAQGWVVINSLRGGAAGGGTRMRLGLDKSEVESLAKVMEIKFTVSGPSIGGAKSGINFDPFDPRKDESLVRSDIIVFVALHELAHVCTESIGHGPDFWNNFGWLLQEAEAAGIYQRQNFQTHPAAYCGIYITDAPSYDATKDGTNNSVGRMFTAQH